jgi:hypothetical protein
MSETAGNHRIEDVAPGDIIAVDRGSGELELAAGTTVHRSLQSKWESPQSPTPHAES